MSSSSSPAVGVGLDAVTEGVAVLVGTAGLEADAGAATGAANGLVLALAPAPTPAPASPLAPTAEIFASAAAFA